MEIQLIELLAEYGVNPQSLLTVYLGYELNKINKNFISQLTDIREGFEKVSRRNDRRISRIERSIRKMKEESVKNGNQENA